MREKKLQHAYGISKPIITAPKASSKKRMAFQRSLAIVAAESKKEPRKKLVSVKKFQNEMANIRSMVGGGGTSNMDEAFSDWTPERRKAVKEILALENKISFQLSQTLSVYLDQFFRLYYLLAFVIFNLVMFGELFEQEFLTWLAICLSVLCIASYVIYKMRQRMIK